VRRLIIHHIEDNDSGNHLHVPRQVMPCIICNF
jgi:hypothetical protein